MGIRIRIKMEKRENKRIKEERKIKKKLTDKK